MEEKNLKHERFQVCKLTKTQIDTIQDNYTVVLDCQGKNIVSYGFYKTETLRDLISGKGKKVEEALMKRTQEKALSMMDKMGITKPQFEVQ